MFDKIWAYPVHDRVHALLVDGDDCFFTAKKTHLVALSIADGQERWSVRIENPWGWLAQTPEFVFYLNQHSKLVTLDRASGRMIWSRELPGFNGWLHAHGNTVVVGGWRGYTDIVAMCAGDGTDRWKYPARQINLHSTRVHAQSSSLVLADPRDGGSFVFLDLDTGHKLAKIDAGGQWVGEYSERPPGTSNVDEPLIMDAGDSEFFVIRGEDPQVDRTAAAHNIWSRNLSTAGEFVPYLTPQRELVVWSLVEEKAHSLGHLQHNRRDLLPCTLTPDGSIVVATSFGRLNALRINDATPIRCTIAKGVSTNIACNNGVVVIGTDSGQVLGLSI